MPRHKVGIIGAGIGGLVSAIDLAARGFKVQVFDKAPSAGGKMREVRVGPKSIDAGPTVFTLPGIFEQLFNDAGDDFHRRVALVPAQLLARHAWGTGPALDLYADIARSAAAIEVFSGRRDAEGFRRFAADARRVYKTLESPYMRMQRPSLAALVRRVGLGNLPDLLHIDPFRTLWRATGRYFADPRLRQLFARYATYCGSSPFASPATLMLISHVEQAGVYYIDGGMVELARQLEALAVRQGVRLHYGEEVTRICERQGRVCGLVTHTGQETDVDAIVCNTDSNALAQGLLGASMRRATRATDPSARSLSAVTVNLVTRTEGFELAHHTVFFCSNYRAEFDAIFRRNELPAHPTVYVCAQDRRDATLHETGADERLLCLINAPAIGDRRSWTSEETDQCECLITNTLATFGLSFGQPQNQSVVTTPADFDRLFPATGGALYGPASHGWMASFKRTGSRTAVPGLYLAGGSVHPGPGVPMAALSGRLAAASIIQDFASIAHFVPAHMPGGTSMG